ncbi:MAG TPA: hypothetical protein VGF20_13360 [Candidatus Acidoferrum sp.]|jgi:hypothetical protein
MPPASTKKIALFTALAFLLVAALLIAWRSWPAAQSSSRQQLLQLVPTDSTAVIFLDLDEFRSSPFLAKLYSWAPRPAEDSEYAQFVHDSGFSYERDLNKAVVAISHHGASTNLLAIADGKFDRKKIETFLSRSGTSALLGKLRVFVLSGGSLDKPVSLAFLSDQRIAITDSQNLAEVLSASASQSGHAEWNSRFERLAGTPLFAVIRQDPAMRDALNTAAPGGFRSPQLSALLDQLQWISIAGKPDGDQLRVVSEGECLSDVTTGQLREFLQGIQLLAQNGLNDPKLRQQMNPDERATYLDILKSADVQKIDRGEWKTVRVVLSITPKFLDLAKVSSLTAPRVEEPAPAEKPKQKSGKSPGKERAKEHLEGQSSE